MSTTETQDIKDFLARELERSRGRSLGLTTEVLDETELTAQHSRLMSPLVWDLAHVGNYEELWLLRATTGAASLRPEIDPLYDAFEHPRATRPSLPLLTPAESLDYLGLVRRQVLDTLEQVRLDDSEPLLASGFVYRMVLQHEHPTTRRCWPPTSCDAAPAPCRTPRPPRRPERAAGRRRCWCRPGRS